MKHIVLSALLFLGAAGASIVHITARTEMRATAEVCALVRDNYFRADDSDVQTFLKKCETDSIPFVFKRVRAIRDINSRLSQIHSSHLSLYSPDENRRLWDNEGSDTGIRSRLIDGELVITSTLENSPARRADLRAGDAVVSINGQDVPSPDDAQATAGSYKIARGKTFFITSLRLENVQEDLRPRLSFVSPSSNRAVAIAVLKIPSFLPQYFEEGSWGTISERFRDVKHAVIDLRGNPGGSFPAMLRALSVFRCGGQNVGSLWRRKRAGDSESREIPNELDAQRQLELLQKTDRLLLKTFKTYTPGRDESSDDEDKISEADESGTDQTIERATAQTAEQPDDLELAPRPYPCFHGDTVVLVDEGTSSVSEIFAQAMTNLPDTKIWGWPTAGQVVMARWFQVGSLGGGDYAMSIPIAGFRAENGEEIERIGLRPKRELQYDLAAGLRGEDSWINEAIKSFSH